MLIFDRTHRAWAITSLLVTLVATGAYVWYATQAVNGPTGGSLPGLMFGIIAAGMMVFAGLLAARRRFPAARLGSAQFWMRGHIWIGTLTVPFALFHAGFGWGGRVENLLWILFFSVILSGFWGLALQQILPRLMLEQLPHETFVEQIPYLCTRFTAESDHLLADICGPLEVPLTAVELKQFEPHLKSHFEEDRKKRRNDYPKTVSDAVHFQIFLRKLYAGLPPLPTNALPVTAPTAPAESPSGATAPPLKSVAQKTPSHPENQHPIAAVQTDRVPPAGSVESAPASTPTSTTPVGKPDPKAMLAAMKARKAAAETESVTAQASPFADASDTVTPSTPNVTAKPDPKAMLAAMKVKQAAAKSTSQPATPTLEDPTAPQEGHPQVSATSASSTPAETAPVAAASGPAGKPDPKAMLAAMKAKKMVATEATATSTPTPSLEAVAKSSPGPALMQKPVHAPAATTTGQATTAGRVPPPSKGQLEELKQFYLELIRPQLPMQPDTYRWMEAIRKSMMACSFRQDSLHPEFIGIFDQLKEMCEQRRQFAFVQRYHRWLHHWLLIHIPATVALYLVLLFHAIMALRVIPFGN